MIFSEICEYLVTRLKVPTEINGFLLSIDAKNRREKGFRFTAGSIFRSISRVMGVINEFGLR